jgi:HK97 family phage portal protein
MLKYLSKFFSKPEVRKEATNFFLTENNYSHIAGASEYSNNVIVFRCVNMISQAASHIPWVVLNKSTPDMKKLKDHPIYSLLRKPNNMQSGSDFFSELVASKLLYGNAYILAQGARGVNSMLLLHPDNVELVIEEGVPTYYKYRHNNRVIKFPINPKTHKSQILHIKNYNPKSSVLGVSCVKAASKSIELHNATSEWNNALLKNGARPTGALIMKDSSQYLSPEQFERLQDQLYQKFSGSQNSGKPLLLEGGLEWRDMSVNPRDMDYIESKAAAAREIALAFGLPPQLLGISGDNTYSNMQEARLALWEETIIPLLDKISDSLSNWFSSWFSDDIIIDFDRNSISALSEKRQNSLEKIASANFMTINEKRAIFGLAPINGGDLIDDKK